MRSNELHVYFSEHETTEVARIHTMLEVFASDQCLTHRLARYFGDVNAPERCGHCSVCHGQVAYRQSRPHYSRLRTGIFSTCVAISSASTMTTTASYPAPNA